MLSADKCLLMLSVDKCLLMLSVNKCLLMLSADVLEHSIFWRISIVFYTKAKGQQKQDGHYKQSTRYYVQVSVMRDYPIVDDGVKINRKNVFSRGRLRRCIGWPSLTTIGSIGGKSKENRHHRINRKVRYLAILHIQRHVFHS